MPGPLIWSSPISPASTRLPASFTMRASRKGLGLPHDPEPIMSVASIGMNMPLPISVMPEGFTRDEVEAVLELRVDLLVKAIDVDADDGVVAVARIGRLL